MPSQKKYQVVADLQDKAGRASSIVFAKYTGLSVAQFTELRQKIREAGGEIVVARNRLVNVALGAPQGLIDILQDQLFTLFSYEDAVSAVKALYEYNKDNENLEVKGGYFENKVLSTADVDRLSKVPSRVELMGMLVQRLQNPGYGLRNVLNAGPQKLVLALQAVAEQKKENNA